MQGPIRPTRNFSSPGEAGALRPLRRPGFRYLVATRTVNELGFWLGTVALAVLVFDATGSALATTALFLGVQFAPALVAPAVVARIELVETRLSLVAISLAEAATFAALALTAEPFLLAVVIGLAAVDGVLALTTRTLTRAVAATLLQPSGELRAGNALLNVGFTVAAATGPALAGLVVSGLGARAALWADAVIFLALALVLATARSLPRAQPDGGAGARAWRARLREGLTYVSKRPLLRRLAVSQGAALLFFVAVIPVEVVYAKDTLDVGDAGFGALLTSWGVGMVAGSLVLAAALRASLWRLLLFSTLAVGTAYLVLGVAGTLVVACAASVLGGTGNGIQFTSLMNAIQELTDRRFQARVVGLIESLQAAVPGLAYVLGGLAASLFSPRATYLLAGAGVFLVVAVAAPFLRGAELARHGEPAPPDDAPASALDRGRAAESHAAG